MKNFIKTLFAVIFGNIIFFGFFFLILMGIIVGASMSSSEKDSVSIPDDAILKLSIAGQLSDLPQKKDIQFGGSNAADHSYSIHDLTKAISDAGNDAKIKAMYIPLTASVEASYAQLDLIREAIRKFKESKKPVYAYGEIATQKSYYLASLADKIYLNPHGGMELLGFGAQLMFLKGTLDKLEVQPQIFYAGKFKSATEPLRLEKMSEENKIQTRELLSDISNRVIENIAYDRKITTDSVHAAFNQMRSNTPDDALASKLIDGKKYLDEFEAELKQKIKADLKEKLSYTTIDKYIMNQDESEKDGNIAVYVAEGDIIDGKSVEGSVGSETVVSDLRKIAEDEDIKAVVLRVNSPGGSALASAVMLREIELLRKKKPVVVSMGNLAASGGYYISTSASKVFAEPNTITGSIGVFGIIPNVKNMLQNKAGITFDEVELHEHAVMGINKDLDPVEVSKIQTSIEEIYLTFKSEVAKGRKLSMDSVESIAQGRVWSGERAKKLGLVDEIGGLRDAVKAVAAVAKLQNTDFFIYNQRKSAFELFMEDLTGQSSFVQRIRESILEESLGEYARDFQNLMRYTKLRGAQMRMYFSIDI